MADNLTSWQPISKRRSGVWGCGDPPVRGLPSSHIMGCALLALLVVGVVAQASVLHARPSSHTLTTSQQEAALNPSGGTYLRRALAAWSIWGARRTSSASSRPPPAAVSLTVGTPVAIINPVNWHLEMVCSFMHLVSSVVGADNMTVYQETVGIRNSGFMELVQPLAHTVRLLPAPMDRHKLLIFISPEYRVNLTRIAIEQSQPEEVLLVVHNGDTTVLDELLELHPRIRVITLAPHVRRYLIQRQMKQRKAVHPAIIQGTWMLPVWPWVPEEPCPTHKLHDCLSGFSMQGKIASGRRKYGYVFEQLQQARDICKARPRCAKEVQHLNLQVVGKLKENLTMPDDVAPMVTIHNNLRYQQFYQTLYKTYALIPAMQNSAYFDRKFSSTVVTSLITGTPMVVDKDILHAYPILFQEDVLLQPEGEDGVTDAMVQILTFSSEQLAAKRAAVLRLRDFLNKDAQIKLREVLRSTHGLVSVTTLL